MLSITTIDNAFGQCKDQSITGPAQQWAQQQSSNLFFYQTVASSIPTIIMTYILGLYTHQLGRKFVLILTMFGNVFQYGIWLLIIYHDVSCMKTKNVSELMIAFLVTGLLVVDCCISLKFSRWW